MKGRKVSHGWLLVFVICLLGFTILSYMIWRHHKMTTMQRALERSVENDTQRLSLLIAIVANETRNDTFWKANAKNFEIVENVTNQYFLHTLYSHLATNDLVNDSLLRVRMSVWHAEILVDMLGNPIVLERMAFNERLNGGTYWQFRLRSYGLNAKDDKGAGDDITSLWGIRKFPAGE